MCGGDDSKCPWGFVEYIKGEVGGRGEGGKGSSRPVQRGQ